MIEVEEYLVKFKNFSYLHCQWLTEEELHRGDKRISQKIKRFKQKREKSANVLDFCEDEHFNPDYVEVDRVLDASIHTDEDTGVVTKHFLVKWRSLPYEDCKWLFHRIFRKFRPFEIQFSAIFAVFEIEFFIKFCPFEIQFSSIFAILKFKFQ